MSYKPPYHYTQDELDRATLDDLITDLRCARRDGLDDYGDKVQKQIFGFLEAHPAFKTYEPIVSMYPECSICRRRHESDDRHPCE